MIKLSIRYATKLTCDYCFIVQHIKNFCSNLISFHSSLSSYIFAWLFFLLKSFLFLRFSFFYFLFCNFVIFLYSGRIYFYVAISRSYSKFENPLQKIFFEHFSSNINSIVPLRQRKAVVWRYSVKKVFSKILQNPWENICVTVASNLQLYQKDTPVQLFIYFTTLFIQNTFSGYLCKENIAL